tara:strand:+ start:33 stop:197 length:165 start_codon:yes stop_codon:yes gene_type:complete
MKQYYEVNGQKRYYIAKRITHKENKENFIKVLLQMGAIWLVFFSALLLFLHLID